MLPGGGAQRPTEPRPSGFAPATRR